MEKSKKFLGVGIITAIAASLCCITPILAIIAGTSGIASTFTWIEPFRPYLIGLTILALGFAWYQKLKREKDIDCECDTDEKGKFIHSMFFLGIVTLFAVVMLAFPYYSEIFYPSAENHSVIVEKSSIKSIEFSISGMTCSSCEEHINYKVNNLNGIVNSKASYEKGNAIIQFDKTKTTKTEIEKAINSTGYKVTDIKGN